MDRQSGIVSEKAAQAARSARRTEDDEAGPSSPRYAGHAAASASAEDEQETLTAHQNEPPPYSGPSSSAPIPRRPVPPPLSSSASLPKGPQRYPGLPVLDYRQYSPPMFDLSADSTTISSKATYLSENAQALSSLLRTLATVPPKPQIHIQGTRRRRVDFDVRLNLMSLLVPEEPQNRMDYLRCVSRDEMAYRGGNEPSLKPELGDGLPHQQGRPLGAVEEGAELEAWCARFVADQSSIKTFTLQRVVANLDQHWLEGQIRGLVASIGYKGLVTVSFPVTHARVTIQSPDKVNKFFTSVTALFSGKAKYEVVKSVWPFADIRNGQPGRKCIVQSEKTWWEEWREPIKYAIAQQRQGWITNEDKLECIMESKGKKTLVDWGPDDDNE